MTRHEDKLQRENLMDESRMGNGRHYTYMSYREIKEEPQMRSFMKWVFDQCGGSQGLIRLAEIGRNIRRGRK